jgi:hypothetical protein
LSVTKTSVGPGRAHPRPCAASWLHSRFARVLWGACLLSGQALAQGPAATAPNGQAAVSTSTAPTGTAPTGTAPTSRADGASAEPTAEEKAAQEQAAREEAGQRFQRGLGFYEDGDHALALIEFDRAYQLVPDYRVLYNIGQVSIQLARFARARMALEQYMAEGGTAIPAERAVEVNRDLRMLQDRTAHLELTSSEAGAEVLINDRSYGETPLSAPLLLDAGEHQIVLRKKGFQTGTRRVVLAGAERLPLTIQLQPLEEQVVIVQKPDADPVTKPPPVESSERRGPDPAVFTWIATGVLAAAATTTGILGLDAKSRHDAEMGRPSPDEDVLAAAKSEAEAFFLACDILMVGTAAAFGTSLYLTLHQPKSSTKSAAGSVEVALLPHAVRLRMAF